MFLAQSTMCNAVRFKHQRVLSNKMRTCICLKWAEWEHIFSPWVHPLLVAHCLTKRKKKKEEEKVGRANLVPPASAGSICQETNSNRLSAVTGLLPLTRAHERVRPPEIKGQRWLGVFAARRGFVLLFGLKRWQQSSESSRGVAHHLLFQAVASKTVPSCAEHPPPWQSIVFHRGAACLLHRTPHTHSRPWLCVTL